MDASARAAGPPAATPSGGTWLERIARAVVNWTGSTAAFALASGIAIVWAASGPYFHFADTWQLVINTGTTIVTFLMVFLIQRAQNKDAAATHLQLDEVVAAIDGASNRLLCAEDLSEADSARLHARYDEIVKITTSGPEDNTPHSIDETTGR